MNKLQNLDTARGHVVVSIQVGDGDLTPKEFDALVLASVCKECDELHRGALAFGVCDSCGYTCPACEDERVAHEDELCGDCAHLEYCEGCECYSDSVEDGLCSDCANWCSSCGEVRVRGIDELCDSCLENQEDCDCDNCQRRRKDEEEEERRLSARADAEVECEVEVEGGELAAAVGAVSDIFAKLLEG